MSHVDTSIGFSLRSEPPEFSTGLVLRTQNFTDWVRANVREATYPLAAVSIGISVFHLIQNAFERGWHGWRPFIFDSFGTLGVGLLVFGVFYLWIKAKCERQGRAIIAAGFDSPVIQLTAEGQWVTFRFASGREFVDRWDRLLRFKSAPDFTEFEFVGNPPIIIPTMALPVATIRTISQFCAVEKIPSETKR